MYLLNEKKYIEEILASGKKPDGLTMGYLIALTAKYFFPDAPDAESLARLVKEKLAELSLENYQEYKYHRKIISLCQELFQGKSGSALREQDFIPIYENELKTVQSLARDQGKKFLFTLYAAARYADCGGWINKKSYRELSELFKLANVTLKSKDRSKLLHELYMGGHISFGKRVDNLNLQVRLDETGSIAYKVKEFENLGFQYIGNFKKGYRQCECCGKIYKLYDENKRSRKYCEDCAHPMKKLRTQESDLRKLSNF